MKIRSVESYLIVSPDDLGYPDTLDKRAVLLLIRFGLTLFSTIKMSKSAF